jgi:hypothetical protein
LQHCIALQEINQITTVARGFFWSENNGHVKQEFLRLIYALLWSSSFLVCHHKSCNYYGIVLHFTHVMVLATCLKL